MKRLAVNGASGRMGRRICALAQDDPQFDLVARFDRATSEVDDARNRDANSLHVDIVIDFSSEQGTLAALQTAERCGAALLVGTTSLSPAITEKLAVSATSIPIMIAPNTSRGVAVLSHLIAQAARLLGNEFDIDIIDVHHSAKRDAPSGTALRLVESLAVNADVTLPAERVHSIRAGDVVGDHEVSFAGPGERIKISHAATTRDVFAHGALQAAAWLSSQKPGMYRIEQSLGLQRS